MKKIYSNDSCPCGSGKKYKNCCGKTTLNKDDLRDSFIECIGFLVSSSYAYDRGVEAEAKRISVEIRKLVHQTNMSNSILHLLGKDNINWFSSICNQMRDTDKYWIGLADYTINVTQKGALLGGKCNPKFGDFSENPNIKDFSAWWSEEVLVDNFQKSYSRSEVVLQFANKDNGAHVDSELDKEYYETTRNCGIGLQVSQGKIKYEGKDAMSATVRQIAHEMIFSLAQVEEFKFIRYIVEYIKNY